MYKLILSGQSNTTIPLNLFCNKSGYTEIVTETENGLQFGKKRR